MTTTDIAVNQELMYLLKSAIKNTPVGYFMQILRQRNPGADAMGSVFDVEQDYYSLMAEAYCAQPYNAGASAIPGCTYIQLPIPGTIGVVSLDSLPEDTELLLADPKNTCGSEGGGVDAYLNVLKGTGEKTEFTVAIVGPGDAKDKDGNPLPVLWTIHPGHTVPRPVSVNKPELIGMTCTPSQAKKLGLTVAKLVVDS